MRTMLALPLVWLWPDPRWKNTRDDPRFDTLIERLRYPRWRGSPARRQIID